VDSQRAINVPRLLSAVRHCFLFWSVVGLFEDKMKRQIQSNRKSAGEIRDKIRVAA
jgi:hypothetical protein